MTEIPYRTVNGVQIPNLSLPETEPIGRYGRMRQRYIKEHRPVLWNRLVLAGTLYEHLSEIETAAQSRIDLMLPKLAEAAGATETLKAERVNLQLNLFDEAEDADTPSAFSCSQEVVDAVLRVGENTSYLRERVVAEFEKQRPLNEIAAFLPTVYHGGVGVSVDGERYAAWIDSDGFRIARGESARYARDAQLLAWSDAAERISELLNTGQYAGSWELERSTATERELFPQP